LFGTSYSPIIGFKIKLFFLKLYFSLKLSTNIIGGNLGIHNCLHFIFCSLARFDKYLTILDSSSPLLFATTLTFGLVSTFLVTYPILFIKSTELSTSFFMLSDGTYVPPA